MVEQVHKHAEWLDDLRHFQMSQGAADFIRNGNVYISGRDKRGYPNLVMSIKGLKKVEAKEGAD